MSPIRIPNGGIYKENEIQWKEIVKTEGIRFRNFRNLCIQFSSIFSALITLISP
ncbi:hypothetical protein LEP1GSC089_2049 [Leptospira interrogans serovar Autumnalis str. LP101]|nr:hypothetical protein LEP1GSC089_2049 [Leptospira interrogans serovar Autumnalis str. LP101]